MNKMCVKESESVCVSSVSQFLEIISIILNCCHMNNAYSFLIFSICNLKLFRFFPFSLCLSFFSFFSVTVLLFSYFSFFFLLVV